MSLKSMSVTIIIIYHFKMVDRVLKVNHLANLIKYHSKSMRHFVKQSFMELYVVQAAL